MYLDVAFRDVPDRAVTWMMQENSTGSKYRFFRMHVVVPILVLSGNRVVQ